MSAPSTVAVVTGATRGIGLALTDQMLRAGMTVYAVGVDTGRVAAMAKRLAHPRLRARQVDVSDLGAWESLLDEVRERDGRVDWVVNNAGLLGGGELADARPEQLQRLIDVNVWGVVHGSRLAAAIMREQRSGTIVNVASMAGVFPVPFSAVYTATKHAVFGFSLALREELAPYGVGVHVVCPDVVDTEIFDRALDTAAYSYKSAIARHAGRAITADEAARHVLAGVAKGRAVVYTPPRSRVLGTIGRMFPSFIGKQVAARMAPAADMTAAIQANERRAE
jgi:short-subunit dehydrogenase